MHKHGQHHNEKPKPAPEKGDQKQDTAEGEKVKNVNFKAAAAAEAYTQAQGQPAVENVTVDVESASEKANAEATKSTGGEPDYKTMALRTAAEFDNFRKRVAREKVQWKREALADFLKDFLPAFDDLNRALAESEKAQSLEVLREGVVLVRANLWKTMEKAGVREIIAHEQPFDPRFHEALTMLPIPGKEAGVVVEVFQPGYAMEEQVLRPSKVVVSGEPPQE